MAAKLPRLAIFGASGQTGRVLVRQALDRNHPVTLLVRDPAKLPAELRADADRVSVIKGDVTNYEDVRRTIVAGNSAEEEAAGRAARPAGAVLSCLGTQILSGPPTQVHSLGVRNMIKAMKSPGAATDRIVAMSAIGVGETAADVPFWAWPATYLANNFILREVQADKAIMERELVESGLDYSIIRPPGLTNGALTGNYTFGPGLFGLLVSRADVADLMLKCVEEGACSRQGVTIKYW
ncbi:hypothetical protein DFJ74DRAFT_697315 [Hyaloraphidium curvatum]|nr:hypothetical protein DFJ74DRAFT_697315 [Hyaloraphidium curvatum]